MFKTLHEKISKFTILYPGVMMYGITIGATLEIALALSYVINPHDILAVPSGGSKTESNSTSFVPWGP